MTTLTPTLDTIDQLYQKVRRESYRTFHSKDSIHKADHFYNFCITAHALRDYFLEYKGWGGDRETKREYRAERKKQHVEWDSNELLAAVREIANSAKHFSLSRPPQTRGMEERRGSVVEVYSNGSDLYWAEAAIPDFVVTMASGEEFPLFELMSGVSEYWREFLGVAGVRLGDDPHYFPDEAS